MSKEIDFNKLTIEEKRILVIKDAIESNNLGKIRLKTGFFLYK